MGDDRIRDGAILSGPRVGLEHLLPQSLGEAIRVVSDVEEDASVGEVGQQAAPMGNPDGRVQCDGLPDAVDVGFGDAVFAEQLGGQIGTLDLEASLSLRVLAEP